MCNLYSLTTSRQAMLRLFRVSDNRAAAFEALPAIFPARSAPVVRPTADGDVELVVMSWGFVLPQPGKAPRRVTNVRDDKARSSSFWRDSFEARRCLIPASSFAEPHDGRTPATWHWFALQGDEPRPLFAFAGIWRRWVGTIKKDGPPVELDTYSFMTTAPNALTASINHERSPVLLTTPDQWQTWTTGKIETAMGLIKPIAADRLRIVQEGLSKRDEG